MQHHFTRRIIVLRKYCWARSRGLVSSNQTLCTEQKDTKQIVSKVTLGQGTACNERDSIKIWLFRWFHDLHHHQQEGTMWTDAAGIHHTQSCCQDHCRTFVWTHSSHNLSTQDETCRTLLKFCHWGACQSLIVCVTVGVACAGATCFKVARKHMRWCESNQGTLNEQQHTHTHTNWNLYENIGQAQSVAARTRTDSLDIQPCACQDWMASDTYSTCDIQQGVNLQLMSARKISQILNKARPLTLLSDQAGRFPTLPALSHTTESAAVTARCPCKAIAALMLAQLEVCQTRVQACIADLPDKWIWSKSPWASCSGVPAGFQVLFIENHVCWTWYVMFWNFSNSPYTAPVYGFYTCWQCLQLAVDGSQRDQRPSPPERCGRPVIQISWWARTQKLCIQKIVACATSSLRNPFLNFSTHPATTACLLWPVEPFHLHGSILALDYDLLYLANLHRHFSILKMACSAFQNVE